MMKKNVGLMGCFALSLMADKLLSPDFYLQKEKELEYNPGEVSDDKPLVKRIPPRGTKEYFFNDKGEFASKNMQPMCKDEAVFWCYAINDSNAIRKFNKFKASRK